jgi:hypothetical protein
MKRENAKYELSYARFAVLAFGLYLFSLLTVSAICYYFPISRDHAQEVKLLQGVVFVCSLFLMMTSKTIYHFGGIALLVVGIGMELNIVSEDPKLQNILLIFASEIVTLAVLGLSRYYLRRILRWVEFATSAALSVFFWGGLLQSQFPALVQ